MGAGHGRKRRLWVVSGSSPGDFRLDALPGRRPRYARYTELLWFGLTDGTEIGWYWVEEYTRFGAAKTANAFAGLPPGYRARLALLGREYVEQLADYHETRRPTEQYMIVIEESETFWITSVRRLNSQSTAQDGARMTPTIATYRSLRSGHGLDEHQGCECVVYALERQQGKRGLHVTSRCGVRFGGDDSYWVVPAIELDIGPLAIVP